MPPSYLLSQSMIQEDEVQLWLTFDSQIKNQELLNAYLRLLAPCELVRQRKFHFEKHRHQYLVARALVRTVLSFYVNGEVTPSEWQFGKNSYGKPHIIHPEFGKKLSFNLSHCESAIVLAITQDRDIGVDIEWLHRQGQTIELASHYFSPLETKQLQSLPAQMQKDRFYDLWTLKESYVKARGKGLSIPLDSFSFEFTHHNNIRIQFAQHHTDTPEYWQFWQIQASHSHRVAIATKSENTPCKLSMREIVPLQSFSPVNLPVIRQT